MTLPDDLAATAEEHDFSGNVLVTQHGRTLSELARGEAHRALGIPNEIGTRFALASVTKGLTALTVVSLIESGELTFDTTLVSVLGDRVAPFVDERVTIRQLLGHTSGVGDYIDEDEQGDIDDPPFEISPGDIDTPSAALSMLAKYPQRETPGAEFRYNNSGFVLLALAVEAATGESYFDLVHDRVTRPAEMHDTDFPRSDDLPAGVAINYLASGRSNVFKVPVRGAGDGGAFSTVADIGRLWAALLAGRIVSLPMVEDMTTVHRLDEPQADGRGYGYGLGFWMWSSGDTVQLEGYDAGVSCRSVHDRPSGVTYTVVSNTAEGAWPVARFLDGRIRAGWVD